MFIGLRLLVVITLHTRETESKGNTVKNRCLKMLSVTGYTEKTIKSAEKANFYHTKHEWEGVRTMERIRLMYQRNKEEEMTVSRERESSCREKKGIRSYRERETDVGCLLLGNRKHSQKQR